MLQDESLKLLSESSGGATRMGHILLTLPYIRIAAADRKVIQVISIFLYCYYFYRFLKRNNNCLNCLLLCGFSSSSSSSSSTGTFIQAFRWWGCYRKITWRVDTKLVVMWLMSTTASIKTIYASHCNACVIFFLLLYLMCYFVSKFLPLLLYNA